MKHELKLPVKHNSSCFEIIDNFANESVYSKVRFDKLSSTV